MIRSSAPSIFKGQTASRYTSDGTPDLGLPTTGVLTGNFTGSSETLSAIVEQGNASACDLGIWNATASAWVFLVRYTFADQSFEVLSGDGDTYSYLLREGHLSGHPVHWLRLIASSTAGQSRRAYFFPATQDPSADDYSVIHYVGWEENGYGSNPLNAADVAGEQHYYANFPPPREMAVYFSGSLGAPSTVDGNLWYVGGIVATNPALKLHVSSESFVASHHNGSVERTCTVTPDDSWGPDTTLEAVVTLSETGTVHLIVCIDGTTYEGAESASSSLASAWGAEGALVLMKTTGFLRKHTMSMIAVKLEEMDTVPGTDDPDDVLWEFRRLVARLNAIGDKL